MHSHDLIRLDELVIFVMLHSVVLKHYRGALCGQRMHIRSMLLAFGKPRRVKRHPLTPNNALLTTA